MAETISFPRGNSKAIIIELKVDDAAYTLSQGDTAIFTVKERKEKGVPVKMQKKLTAADCDPDGKIIIEISPSDTVDWRTGEDGKEYYWDFAVKFANDAFYTPVTDGVLLLTPALGEIGDVT
ncbi:MAG: hypothetical protein ACI4YB_02090 [Oscillospiraceae bacterium]